MYFETWDGLYAPMALRLPSGDGPFPIILLGSGNGGEAMRWHRTVLAERSYILDALIEAGYACAWLRYRTEVELGYNDGGALVRDMRQGREMFSRSPLEYEDEIAAIEFVKQLDVVDADRVGLVGVSHAGEMILKLTSEYHGAAVGVCCEPASHEYLALTPDDTAFVNEETQMRNIEDMQMAETEKVRRRIDIDVAAKRSPASRRHCSSWGATKTTSRASSGPPMSCWKKRQGRRVGVLRPPVAWLHLPGARCRWHLHRRRHPAGSNRTRHLLPRPAPLNHCDYCYAGEDDADVRDQLERDRFLVLEKDDAQDRREDSGRPAEDAHDPGVDESQSPELA